MWNVDFLATLDKVFEKEERNGLAGKDLIVNKAYTEEIEGKRYTTKSNGAFVVSKPDDEMGKPHVERLVPKIPFKYYLMTLEFFQRMYKAYGTEAGLLFYYKTDKVDLKHLKQLAGNGLILDGDLIIYCPQQEVSGGVFIYSNDETYEYLDNTAIQFCCVHSHHTMGINWSGTDDAYMKRFEGYTVFRHIHQFGFTSTRTSVDGFIDLDESDIWDVPEEILEVWQNKHIQVEHLVDRNSHLYQDESIAPYLYAYSPLPEIWLSRNNATHRANVYKDYLESRGLSTVGREDVSKDERSIEEVPQPVKETLVVDSTDDKKTETVSRHKEPLTRAGSKPESLFIRIFRKFFG